MTKTYPERTCRWHQCRAKFTPTHYQQEFCCKEHRIARNDWRMRRGSVLVDPLIDGRWKDLEKLQQELIREISQ